MAIISNNSIRASALGGAAWMAIAATGAVAQDAERPVPVGVENISGIVIRDDLNLNVTAPEGALDNAVNVTGVGQMIIDAGGGSVGLCTGTLINPRTVIFAAHCVNDQAANSYGAANGGTAIGFGFEANNLPATRQYLGLDGGTLHATNTARSFYNVEQVWYDPRSLALGEGLGFIQADVALATLDTPASDVPTWTILLTPLSGEVHGLVNGYGGRGNGTNGDNLGIDFRRRVGENMISFLGGLDDRGRALFVEVLGGSYTPFNNAPLYQLDFDSPGYTGQFDFDLFDGNALPREATTAGGDSGGPLIVDDLFDRPVVAGVLSGGSRYFGATQPFSSYGSSSFYQPLYAYWDVIVANNPYVYASNRGGNKNWGDASNWIQGLDPAYAIEVDGELVNALPGFAAPGIDNGGPKFGTVCFDVDCVDTAENSEDLPVGTPNSIYIPGGPGSTNFVPNNRIANPARNIKARYYDVTLAAAGTTTVTKKYTIDRLALTGNAGLTMAKGSQLTVLGDYVQTGGTLTLQGGTGGGKLVANEALVLQGFVTGAGTIVAPFTTVIAGTIIPGSLSSTANQQIGFQGNLILSSAATTIITIRQNGSDKLFGISDGTAGSGQISLGGTLFLLPGQQGARFGSNNVIVQAQGGVSGRFDTVASFGGGVVQPQITYNANTVVAKLTAVPFATFINNPTESQLAFANALDTLRYTDAYGALSSLYGAIDYVGPAAVASAFNAMEPRIVGQAAGVGRDQAVVTMNLVGDRLSLLGTSAANYGQMTLVGAPETLMALPGQTQLTGASAAQLGFASTLSPSGRVLGKLPANMSGFVAGGYNTRGTRDGSGTKGWNMAMGLEMEAAPDITIGTAFAFSSDQAALGGSLADAETSQAVAYGARQLGGGVYVGGLASMSNTRLGVQRRADGLDLSAISGKANASSYAVRGELGVNLVPVVGVTLTPRASLGFEGTSLDGYREQGSQFGLMVDGLSDNRVVGRFGAKLSGTVGFALGWRFSPEARVDYATTVAGGDGSYDVRFAAAPELAFALPYAAGDRSWGEIKGGFRLAKDRMSFGAGVESSVGRDAYRDERAVVDFTMRF